MTRGIVVAEEFREAVEAVIQGIRDLVSDEEDERRTLRALRMWKRFLVGLRIKERVDGYEVEGERDEVGEDGGRSVVEDSGMESEVYDEDEAGGFFPE